MTDKVNRATTAQSKMQGHQIYFPVGKPSWFDLAHAQMIGFPKVTHDDFVDTLSMAAHYVHSRHQSTNSIPGTIPPVGGTQYFSPTTDGMRGLVQSGNSINQGSQSVNAAKAAALLSGFGSVGGHRR
jgi:hypothetical protein